MAAFERVLRKNCTYFGADIIRQIGLARKSHTDLWSGIGNFSESDKWKQAQRNIVETMRVVVRTAHARMPTFFFRMIWLP